jgi:DNA-binding HxlR family transcriptional regulator
MFIDTKRKVRWRREAELRVKAVLTRRLRVINNAGDIVKSVKSEIPTRDE